MPERPRDPNQLAQLIVDIARGRAHRYRVVQIHRFIRRRTPAVVFVPTFVTRD
jgi:hypothetical protein